MWHHETAIVESEFIGNGTKIWAWSHICEGAKIGVDCVIGERVYIGPNVVIGDRCKIQNHALIYEGVEIGDEVFVGPAVVTTNDSFPRAIGPWRDRLTHTKIGSGVTLCASVTIVCGITIGEHAFIGAGSIVDQDIKPGWMAYGSPAHHIRKV